LCTNGHSRPEKQLMNGFGKPVTSITRKRSMARHTNPRSSPRKSGQDYLLASGNMRRT